MSDTPPKRTGLLFALAALPAVGAAAWFTGEFGEEAPRARSERPALERSASPASDAATAPAAPTPSSESTTAEANEESAARDLEDLGDDALERAGATTVAFTPSPTRLSLRDKADLVAESLAVQGYSQGHMTVEEIQLRTLSSLVLVEPLFQNLDVPFRAEELRVLERFDAARYRRDSLRAQRRKPDWDGDPEALEREVQDAWTELRAAFDELPRRLTERVPDHLRAKYSQPDEG